MGKGFMVPKIYDNGPKQFLCAFKLSLQMADGWLGLACAFVSSGGSTSLTSWTRYGVRVKVKDDANSALSELEFTRVTFQL